MASHHHYYYFAYKTVLLPHSTNYLALHHTPHHIQTFHHHSYYKQHLPRVFLPILYSISNFAFILILPIALQCYGYYSHFTYSFYCLQVIAFTFSSLQFSLKFQRVMLLFLFLSAKYDHFLIRRLNFMIHLFCILLTSFLFLIGSIALIIIILLLKALLLTALSFANLVNTFDFCFII